MANLGLSICVSGYDTENFQKAIFKTEKQDFWKLISGMFTVMPKGSMASILATVFKTGWMKAIALTYIKKQLINAGLHLRLHDVVIEELKNQMEIYCEVSNITFGDIYKLFFSYEGESEEPYLESVIRPMLRAMDETLPEDIDKAIQKLSSKEIYVLLLRSFNEISFRDIAASLDMKYSAVTMIYYRALKKLRKIMNE